MRKILSLVAVVVFLSACGLTKKDLGMARVTPDDGYQSRKERLVIPPDYDVRPTDVAPAAK